MVEHTVAPRNTVVQKMSAKPCARNLHRGQTNAVKQVLKSHCGDTGKRQSSQWNRNHPSFQTKLAINPPGDPYEKEADRIADRIMTMPSGTPINTGAPLHIQRVAGVTRARTDILPTSVTQTLSSPGSSLEPGLRHDMERRFNYDFSQVRLHIDASAQQSAREVDAIAYTVGHDIVFSAGQFVPHTSTGQRLLAHELTHVVQQAGSPNGGVLQRQRRGAAAGCGICLNDPRGSIAGDIAHTEVQDAFTAANPDIVAEREVPGIPGSGIDLSYEKFRLGQHALFIGEIKPLDDAGQQAGLGRRQLQDYAREVLLSGEYDEVFRMGDPPPPGPLYFFNPMNPPGCPEQTIVVQFTEPGLYQYFCEPPFSQLVRNRACRCRREDEKKPTSPPAPPVWVRPDVQPSSSDTEGKGEDQLGDNAPGKDNGEPKPNRKPIRTPGRDQPQQPFLRIPNFLAWAIMIIGTIAVFSSLWGKIGGLLGMLARTLGFTLGMAGTAMAEPDVSKGGTDARGKPIKIPTPDGAITSGAAAITAGSGVGKTDKSTSKTAVTAIKPLADKVTKVDLIEGLNLDKLTPGMVLPVVLSNLHSKHYVSILMVNSVVKKKNETTVKLVSLQERPDDVGTHARYTVTHPHRGSSPLKLVGQLVKIGPDSQWFLDYLNKLAGKLENAGRKGDAVQIRNEVQRVKSLLQKSTLAGR